MTTPEAVERVARAIVSADEQNGGPSWEMAQTMGKHVMGPIIDRARAAIAAMPSREAVIEECARALDALPITGSDREAVMGWILVKDTCAETIRALKSLPSPPKGG